LANGLRLGDLQQGRAGVADGKEQLGIFVATDRAVTPVHGYVLLSAGAGLVLRLGNGGRDAGKPHDLVNGFT
jgi:hypothetical protein